MPRTARRLAAALVVCAFVSIPAASLASSTQHTYVEAENASPAFDVLVMRPLGLAGLAASAVIWLPAQTVTMMVRPSEWQAPIDIFLKKPARFVFQDPIGSH